MSDIGFYSGLYEQLRDFAELVDRTLIALKSGTSAPALPDFQRLGQLLVTASQDPPTDLSSQLMSTVLRGSRLPSRQAWFQLAHDLAAKPDESVVNRLESVALALEERRTGTLARMRGRTR